MKRRTFLRRVMAMGASVAMATSSLTKIVDGKESLPMASTTETVKLNDHPWVLPFTETLDAGMTPSQPFPDYPGFPLVSMSDNMTHTNDITLPNISEWGGYVAIPSRSILTGQMGEGQTAYGYQQTQIVASHLRRTPREVMYELSPSAVDAMAAWLVDDALLNPPSTPSPYRWNKMNIA